jgi:hypothetical protein
MRELPSLTGLFDSTCGRGTRIAGSRRWPGAPLLLPVTGHTVKATRLMAAATEWEYEGGARPSRLRQ